jgi:hypothetical protein
MVARVTRESTHGPIPSQSTGLKGLLLKHCAVSMACLFGCELVALCPQNVRADAFPCLSAPSPVGLARN